MNQNRESRDRFKWIVNLSLTKEQWQYNWEKLVFSINCARKTEQPNVKKKKKNLDTNLTPFTEITSKCITDLKSIKHIEDKIREKLHDLGFSDAFVDKHQRQDSWKTELIKLDFIKIKFLCSVRDIFKENKRRATNWKKIFAKDISDKGLSTKIYKKILETHKQENKNPNLKMGHGSSCCGSAVTSPD